MRRRSAFTLIELLVVIAIIGLLATLAVFAVANARQQARDAKRVADIKQMQNALDLYATTHQGYPAVAAWTALGSTLRCLDDGGMQRVAPCTNGVVYMADIPKNPSPAVNEDQPDYRYIATNADVGRSACTIGPCANYFIEFQLERGVGSLRSTDGDPIVGCVASPEGPECA